MYFVMKSLLESINLLIARFLYFSSIQIMEWDAKYCIPCSGNSEVVNF